MPFVALASFRQEMSVVDIIGIGDLNYFSLQIKFEQSYRRNEIKVLAHDRYYAWDQKGIQTTMQ